MASTSSISPLRILCLEDNPLIVFHLEHMIEDLGHVFCGAMESFAQLRNAPAPLKIDVALVDIDLADGGTGPDAARWLQDQGVPAVFITGQKDVAARHADVVAATLIKPIAVGDLQRSLDLIRSSR
jgi:AmiR/NasT family two-component response regulator